MSANMIARQSARFRYDTPAYGRLSRNLRARALQALTLLLCLHGLPAGADEDYVTGFIPDDAEIYAATPEAPRYRAWVPPETDLSAWFPAPGRQGAQASCGAWATAYAARAYYAARRRGQPPLEPADRLSPAYIYNQIKNGSCKAGSQISKALILMRDRGVATWPDFPYDPADCSRLPGPELTAKAARFRISGYERVEAEDLDKLKEQIAGGHPVIFGMDVSDDLYRLKCGIYNDLSAEGLGRNGHALVLVGYSEPRRAFKVINSWGPNWGERGFGWISYAALRKRIVQAYVMKPPPDEAQRQDAPPAPIPTPPPVTRPSGLNAEGLNRLIARLAGPGLCGDLRGRLSGGNRVILSGFAGRERDIDPIAQALQAQCAVVTRDIVPRPWPQCEVLVNLRTELAQPRGLKVSIAGQADAALKAGDTVMIEVITPSTPSYLYLTYVQADGNAVHLTRPLGRYPKPLPPNTRLVFGDGQAGRARFTASPPFGPEAVVAIAAPQPLFSAELPPTQIERDYLNQFRQALSGRGSSAAVALSSTQPR